MLFTSLPFDYVTLLDPGDRVRRVRKTDTGNRVRRAARKGQG